MLRVSILFFILAFVSLAVGVGQVAGISFELGRLFLILFLAVSLLSAVGAALLHRSERPPA